MPSLVKENNTKLLPHSELIHDHPRLSDLTIDQTKAVHFLGICGFPGRWNPQHGTNLGDGNAYTHGWTINFCVGPR